MGDKFRKYFSRKIGQLFRSRSPYVRYFLDAVVNKMLVVGMNRLRGMPELGSDESTGKIRATWKEGELKISEVLLVILEPSPTGLIAKFHSLLILPNFQ